jgi:hypothetical protein
MTTVDRSGAAASPTPYTNLPTRPAVKDASLEQRAQEQREAEYIRAVFGGKRGKDALDVLRALFSKRAAYHRDHHIMIFFDGQRSVVDYIEECLKP